MTVHSLRSGRVSRRFISQRRCFFFFSSRRRHTRCGRDWSSDVCSSDLGAVLEGLHLVLERVEGRDQYDGQKTRLIATLEPLAQLEAAHLGHHDVEEEEIDRKSTRLNSSHVRISYAVFCLKKKNTQHTRV